MTPRSLIHPGPIISLSNNKFSVALAPDPSILPYAVPPSEQAARSGGGYLASYLTRRYAVGERGTAGSSKAYGRVARSASNESFSGTIDGVRRRFISL